MYLNNLLENKDLIYKKAKKIAAEKGKDALRIFLSLYCILKSKDVPLKNKLIIGGALSYLFLPIDVFSIKRYKTLGWIDNIAAFYIAYKQAKKFVTPEIISEVDNILEVWFPGTNYEIIDE